MSRAATGRARTAGAAMLLACAIALASCGDEVGVGDDAGTRDAGGVPSDGAAVDAPASPIDGAIADGGTIPAGECEPLPAATGTIVRVVPSQADELVGLVRDAAAGTTFLLADGTYRMTGGDEASRRLQIRATGITIRSESGNAGAVVIDGEYDTNEIIGVYASGATIAELTITHAIDHAIHVSPPDGGPDVLGTRLYGVRILDCGEQFVKVNPPGARDAWTDGGIIECSYFEMTDAGRPNVERSTGGCYTGGIDVHSSRDWIVRRNRFVGIYCAGEGLAEHAIHFWVGSRGTLVERNEIVDCARGIGFGLIESGATRMYPDDPHPGLFVGHYDGIIRNNVIVSRIAYYDTGIELAQARGARVHHNTIIETDTATGRFSSIDARFANTDVTVQNNLVRRLTIRDGATSSADHNLESVPLAYFADVAAGDAHLTAAATGAIDQGVAVPEAGLDIDGETHDAGSAPDLGADER